MLKDLRIRHGAIWNLADLNSRFPIGDAQSPWRGLESANEPVWLDEYIYRGFRKHHLRFLRAVKGRFAVAYLDSDRDVLFLARDWIGEMPFHLLFSPNSVFAANRIGDIQREAGEEYCYSYMRAFPQSHAQEIDLSNAEPGRITSSMRPASRELFYDFERAVRDHADRSAFNMDSMISGSIRRLLLAAVRQRVGARNATGPVPVLLSGGLDSFTIALALRISGYSVRAYTLTVNGQGADLVMARRFASLLDLEHHEINVDDSMVLDAFGPAVEKSECYHLYNVYCAVGMLLLGRALAGAGETFAFCGEAVNEAVGDYGDWQYTNPLTGGVKTLQCVKPALMTSHDARLRLVWGHPHDRAKYNKALGTGLAKHAGSRMIKPVLSQGLDLECPYYDPDLLAHLISLPGQTLVEFGGKAGLVHKVFKKELSQFKIGRDLLNECSKVRLQDASDGGAGGITEVLLSHGDDQRRSLMQYNAIFGANLDIKFETQRLGMTA